MAKESEVKKESVTSFTPTEIGILYQLAQSATISVKDLAVVAELLNKCLSYINSENKEK